MLNILYQKGFFYIISQDPIDDLSVRRQIQCEEKNIIIFFPYCCKETQTFLLVGGGSNYVKKLLK